MMDIDSPKPPSSAAPNGFKSSSSRLDAMPSTAKVSFIIKSYRPTKLFRRDEAHTTPPAILSIDFDDPGELLMTAESDESIQIYSVKDGKHYKQCLSKKYGVKLAKFAHTSSCIVYASTKENDTIRYLSTHDNTFIRYFKGHEGPVTCLAMNPGTDNFISCSKDNTVRIWDANSANYVGKLSLNAPYLAAWDPSATVMAIASPTAQSILLYDYRNFDKEPFATFDVLQHANYAGPGNVAANWTKLEFSNDGKSLLLGTAGQGHYLLDAFSGNLKAWLQRDRGGSLKRLAPTDAPPTTSQGTRDAERHESSGDVCFTPDGHHVLSGARRENVLVWDTMATSANKRLMPKHELEFKSEAAVLAFNPRFNFFASGDRELVFWVPDPHVL